MKITCLVIGILVNGLAIGWFIRGSLDSACSGKDWRPDAKWAAFGLLNVVLAIIAYQFTMLK